MKLRIATLSLLALGLMLAAVPALTQTTYSNGPINGNVDAWTINVGFIVSDSFNVTSINNSNISGATFGMWLTPGDTLVSAELSISSQENGGIFYFDDTVNFTQSGCVMNQFGYDVCRENTTFFGPMLEDGTYWLNLQNATTTGGNPVYWDENSGPSLASQNEVGTIPSEAFTVLGTGTTTFDVTVTTGGTVPEPSSMMLFGSGILSLAGLVRRKLF